MKTKRFLTILLSLVLMLSLLPATAVPASADGVVEVKDETELRAAVQNGCTVKLTGNITLSSTLEINNTITLD